jgi:hypothetical protein
MKRFIAFVFLFLYAYNIAGYLLLFSVLQYRTRSEVKKTLKSSVPETALATFSFHTTSLASGAYSLLWVDDGEFRLGEKLYDIVRSFERGDTTYLICINDVQEERLFEHLDNHVQREMGNSGQASKFDAFKDVFKDSLSKKITRIERLAVEGNVTLAAFGNYSPFNPDVPSLPPRSTPA